MRQGEERLEGGQLWAEKLLKILEFGLGKDGVGRTDI